MILNSIPRSAYHLGDTLPRGFLSPELKSADVNRNAWLSTRPDAVRPLGRCGIWPLTLVDVEPADRHAVQ